MNIKNPLPSAFRLTALVGCTLLASSWNVAWAQADCSTISDYLDCKSEGRQNDVVFVFDTTGSMGGEIEDMQSAVIEFSDKIAEAGIDYGLGLTEYKDFETEPCGDPGDFPYKVYNGGALTTDNTEMRTWIESLEATGGNDGPESLLAGLAHAVTDQNWREEAGKIVIVITDAPPHEDGHRCNEEGNTLNESISQLRKAGIVTHVIGPHNNEAVREIAKKTGGAFFEIRDIRDGSRSLSSILNTIAELISCSYRIRSAFSYTEKDDMLSIETKLIGKEEKVIPHIPGQSQLTVTACGGASAECANFELTADTIAGETVYKHKADMSAFRTPAKLTDFSTLVQVCDFSTTTQATLHIGQCEKGVTPTPQIPMLKVSGTPTCQPAEVCWSTDPFARGYTFFYAPYSDPISHVTLNNVQMMSMGLQTCIGGPLAKGTHLYTAVQANNCSGSSEIDTTKLGVVECK
jgi:hypothetical protein